MRVALFSDEFGKRARFGLSRHCWELIHALRAAAPEARFLPVSTSSRAADAAGIAGAESESIQRVPLSRRVFSALASSIRRPRLDPWIRGTELLHWMELGYTVPTKLPLVVTCHDVGPLSHPQFFSQAHPWLMRRAIDYAHRHAAAIICISRATADALCEAAGNDFDGRLRVIPLAVGAGILSAATQARVDREPVFVFAGSLNPRKNLERVLTAFEAVAARHAEARLQLVGGGGWDAERVQQRLSASRYANRIEHRGYVSDAELAQIYAQATALVYVSLMEGFGLPILEAMACGCPVITSNLSSMPEVAGDAACLVDPTDSGAIAAAMQRLLDDETWRDDLGRRGRARAAEFSWARTARSIMDVYESALA